MHFAASSDTVLMTAALDRQLGGQGMNHHAIRVLAISGIFAAAVASADTTITFGTPGGSPIPAGYGGFNWSNGGGPAINDDGLNPYYISGPAGIIDQFSRASPFDLTGVSFQNFMSEITALGFVSQYTTVISGYLNGKLEDTYTAKYGWGAGTFSGLNIDDVNKITFQTSAVFTDTFCCDSKGNPVTVTTSNPNETNFISSVTVRAAAAPEIDPGSAAAGITLLLGSLLVIRSTSRPSVDI
jgi:hypothetical protein